MDTQLVTPGTQEVLNVILEETAIDLDEVIVTGYSAEGSVAGVNADNLRGIPSGSTVQNEIGMIPRSEMDLIKSMAGYSVLVQNPGYKSN